MSTARGESSAEARLWAGSTLDERSALRRRQLIEAAFDLLGTAGSAAVTVRAVTRSTQLSPRYFYESFSNREELLLAAFDHGFDVIKRAVADAMNNVEPDFLSQARASIDATARCLESDPRLARALMQEPLGEATLRGRAERALLDFVLNVAVASDGTLREADPETLQIVTVAVAGQQLALLMAWSEGWLSVEREQLVEQAVALVASAVGTLA